MDNTFNIPSITRIEYYLASDVNLPFLSINDKCKISDYTVQTPKSLDIIPAKASLTVKNKDSSASNIFDVALSFVIAGNNESTISELNKLNNIRHIFVVKDACRQKYLIGTNFGAFPKISYSLINNESKRVVNCQLILSSPIFPLFVTD